MLDVYVRGEVERISPEAPVPVLRVRERTTRWAARPTWRTTCLPSGRTASCSGSRSRCRGADAAVVARRSGGRASFPDRGRTADDDQDADVARAQQVVRVDEEDDGDMAGIEVERLLAAVQPRGGRRRCADSRGLQQRCAGRAGDSTRQCGARRSGHPGGGRSQVPQFLPVPGRDGVQAEPPRAGGGARCCRGPGFAAGLHERWTDSGCTTVLLTLGEHGMALVDPSGRTTGSRRRPGRSTMSWELGIR